jgi:dTDP-4-amino-4,6-dideoxygalactose transaminase
MKADQFIVHFSELSYQTNAISEKYFDAVKYIMSNSDFINSEIVSKFEKEFARYIGAKYSVSVNSGTDALYLALAAIDISPNDLVITQPNTYFATIESVCHHKCELNLVDIELQTGQMDLNLLEQEIKAARKVNPKKRIIVIPVHLYGSCVDLNRLIKLSVKYDLIIIEDAAQAHGSKFENKLLGTFGLLSTFSFYPAKNLGGFGDGGAIVTNSDYLANKVKVLANHGQVSKDNHFYLGINSRLDALQAAALLLKLEWLEAWNKKRLELTKIYKSLLESNGNIFFLSSHCKCKPNYHLLVVRVKNRDGLIKHLKQLGIEARIHYPMPVHMQKGYPKSGSTIGSLRNSETFCKEILSLPLFPGMKESEVLSVVDSIKKYYS